MLSFTRLKRLKNIFWKTFTDPAANGPVPGRRPGVTTTRSIVKPSGRFRGSSPFRRVEGPAARNVTSPNNVSSGRRSLSTRRRAARCRSERRQPVQAEVECARVEIDGHLPRHGGERSRQPFDVAERNAHHVGSAAIELPRPIGQILGKKDVGNPNAKVAFGFLRLAAGRVREHERAEKDRRCSNCEVASRGSHFSLQALVVYFNCFLPLTSIRTHVDLFTRRSRDRTVPRWGVADGESPDKEARASRFPRGCFLYTDCRQVQSKCLALQNHRRAHVE